MRPILFSMTLLMFVGCPACESARYVAAPDGGNDPILTFSPWCANPGDTVTLTALGECAPRTTGGASPRVFFAGTSDAVPPTITKDDKPNDTCEMTAVVPMGATTGPVDVMDTVDAPRRAISSIAELVIPCPPDAGMPDAGMQLPDAGTANADTAGDVDATHGDPALDIVTSQSFVDNGRPWIRVTFAGAWPRPPYYSHYVKVMLRRAPMVTASHTDQLHDGVASTNTTGTAPANITFVPEANGFRVLFDDPALMFDGYAIECGVLKTMNGTFVQDTSGPFTFERTERPFGP